MRIDVGKWDLEPNIPNHKSVYTENRKNYVLAQLTVLRSLLIKATRSVLYLLAKFYKKICGRG